MVLESALRLDPEKVDRYVAFLSHLINVPADQLTGGVPLTFLSSLQPLQVYELPHIRGRQVILRGVQYLRLGDLASGQTLKRERTEDYGVSAGQNESPTETLSVEERFYERQTLLARGIKRVAIR